MARRGVFGRIPRAAPDLTNTLVALIREANNQEDSNFVDAWKSGGKVEGKGVDDTRLLEHFKMRRDQLSPDDPLWDEWNNRYVQYDFAINESKMSLKFDQKKISEAEMGAFYKKWAGRPEIQQDSEFYRHLLSQAAKWNAAANAGSSAGNARAKAAAHQKWVDATYKSKLQGAETADVWLVAIAKAYGAAPPNADNLDDVYENSDQWHKVLDVIQDGKVDDPYVQKMIDSATKAIKESDPNFTWSEANLRGLHDKADAGVKTLIDHATTKTEGNQWRDHKATNSYNGSRVKATAASERIDIAADTWADKLDACNGDPYCARAATIEYRAKLEKEAGSFLIGAGGDINLQTQNAKQAGMLGNTIRTLTDVINNKKVETHGVAALAGTVGGPAIAANTNIDYTQIDVMLGSDKPGNFIGGVGNLFNDNIHKLDRGGWVSSDPALDNQNQPLFDGDGNPIFNYTVHDTTETPLPGLVPVKGITEFTDPINKTPVVRSGAAGPVIAGGEPKTVTPVQYVRTAAPTVITVDAGGNVVTDAVDSRVAGARLGGATAAQAQSAVAGQLGYTVLTGVIGPDGQPRTMYRTGDGTKGSEYMYHTVPPVAAGTTLRKDPRTGVMTPVLTVTQTPDAKGNQVSVYDASPITSGVGLYRTPSKSLNLPLGSFRTAEASSTSQAIDDIFNKGQGNAVQKATDLLAKFQRGIEKLPLTDPVRQNAAGDLNQLTQVIGLHARGDVGKTLDDDYTTMNQRTPQQLAYQAQLDRAGFSVGKFGITQDEVNRRVTVMEQADQAEARLAVTNRFGWMGDMDPTDALRKGLATGDLAAIAQARKDVTNPTISVSNIKIPGFAPQMQPPSPADAQTNAFNAGVMAGLPGGGPPNNPLAPKPKPFAPPAPPNFALPPSGPTPTTKTPPPPPTPTVVPPTTVPTPTGPVVVPPSGYVPAMPTPPKLPPTSTEHGHTVY